MATKQTHVAGERRTLKIYYPECDYFCEWQEFTTVSENVRIIITADENEGGDKSKDPFFGHYNMFF